MINNIGLDSTEKKSKIFNIKKEKKKKKKRFKRKRHDKYSEDNIKQSIIRHFISFLLDFINIIVNKRIKNKSKTNKKIEFKIDHKMKEKIKVEDLVELNVEKLLKFSFKNKKNEIMNNETKTPINNYNQKQLEEIRNLIGSSLNQFFETKVINIFQEIYYGKKTKKVQKANNVMKKYGIEGMTINLKNFNKYEKLRKKNFENTKKLKIMDNIIKNKFIDCKNKKKNKKLFEIKKNELNS